MKKTKIMSAYDIKRNIRAILCSSDVIIQWGANYFGLFVLDLLFTQRIKERVFLYITSCTVCLLQC